MAPHTTTSALVQQDLASIWHPFTQAGFGRPPVPIVRGKGSWLYAEDGRAFLDGISSWWVNLHGHAHPYIAKKIQAQAHTLEHVLFAGFTHPPAVELSQRLLQHLPGNLSRIFYSDNGSTAVETALKMAFQYRYNLDSDTRQTKVVCLRNSYHGDTFGAMSVAGQSSCNRPFWRYLFGVEAIDPPTEVSAERSLAQLLRLLKTGTVSCFIYEPLIQGWGGCMSLHSAKALGSLLKACQGYGVLTIADEVMTGFGRTGPLFASELLEEKPDIVCLSKGLTGGFMAMGATVCTEAIYTAFLSNTLQQALLHGHSYTGNPLACSSALASLDLLLNDTCKKQRKMIARKHKSFVGSWKEHPKLKRCESLGTILILEYQNEETSYFSSLRDILYDHFLDHGILLRPMGNVLYVMPPYCIKEKELDFIYRQIITTLKEAL